MCHFPTCAVAVALFTVTSVSAAQIPLPNPANGWVINPGQTSTGYFAGLTDSHTLSAEPRFAVSLEQDPLASPGPAPSAVWLKLISIEPTAPPENGNPTVPLDPAQSPPVLEPHVTPEPSTWLLLGTGLVGILGFVALRSTRV